MSEVSELVDKGSISYVYDDAGRRTSMTVQGQSAISYGYDDANRLLSITKGIQSVALSYDDANRRSTLTLPNGIVVSYGYDDANKVTSITYTNGSDSRSIVYEYNDAGERIKQTGSMARTMLPNAVSSTVYDAANRLTSWGSSTLSYDDNGRLTSDGSKTYVWDSRNRLQSIGGGASASFIYDAFGRRQEKTVSGTTTGFLYDGLNFVQELSGTSTTPISNLITGGLDEVFSRTDSSGTVSYATDALGSTVALTSSNGSIVTQYVYDPFGSSAAFGTTTSQQYTGRENDGTGLYYYRARYYDPAKGRFISQDPMGLKEGVNFYSYVHGDPLNHTDPTGLSAADVVAIYNTFMSTVDFMTSDGQRISNPYMNNLSSGLNSITDGMLGEPYLGCKDQEYVVRNQLENLGLDDEWTFSPVSNGVHVWGEAHSSNPADPVITYDPWQSTININWK